MPDQFTKQLKKLDALRRAEDSSALEEFDDEAEQLILQRFGEATTHLETYELAIMGEAETIVNMPQAAQEDATQDLFHKSIEQRRQVLEGCLAEAAGVETIVGWATQSAAPQPTPRAATKPRAVKTKKQPAKTKKPARSMKKNAGPVKKKRATRT